MGTVRKTQEGHRLSFIAQFATHQESFTKTIPYAWYKSSDLRQKIGKNGISAMPRSILRFRSEI